jgi:2-keto-4-pentenoate hydratase
LRAFLRVSKPDSLTQAAIACTPIHEVDMQTNLFDPMATALVLMEAWRSGELLHLLPAGIKPETLDQGYDAQDELLKVSSSARAGWKLGVGSPSAMRTANLSRPLVGQLERARLHESGVHLQLPAATPVTVECEIAFVLDRDLPPMIGRAVDPEDIRSTCVTFEIVRSRFTNRKTVGWPSFAADNVGFEALVVGKSICEGIDLKVMRELAETAVVKLDGVPKAKGLSGDSATDPLGSLAALYQHAAERGVTLRAGDLVTTGAMCEPFDIEGAGHVLSVGYFANELTFSL